MIQRISFPLAALAVIAMSGCSGKAAQSGTGSTDGADSQGAQDASTGADAGSCSWPAWLDPPDDAGGWVWHVAHYYLSCNLGSDFETCLSDDPTTCPTVPGNPHVATNCVDQCKPGEYAVGVGGPPLPLPDGGYSFPPQPTLPSTCRNVAFNPAGVMYSCCPCE